MTDPSTDTSTDPRSDPRSDKSGRLEKPAAESDEWLDEVAWNADGLVPAIAQDAGSGQILMMAWMNRQALKQTVEQQQAVYWSRSRKRLWHKGESSGHTQLVSEIRLDCDADVIVLKVEQIGGVACHTGRANCFYRKLGVHGWETVEPVLKDPAKIYAGNA